jgi:hypothetical protein
MSCHPQLVDGYSNMLKVLTYDRRDLNDAVLQLQPPCVPQVEVISASIPSSYSDLGSFAKLPYELIETSVATAQLESHSGAKPSHVEPSRCHVSAPGYNWLQSCGSWL